MTYDYIKSLLIFTSLAASSDVQLNSEQRRNDEFGFEVMFPHGGEVCIARSGDHPRGFYAWYGSTEPACNTTHIDPSATVLGIYARYNTDFDDASSGRNELSCRDGSENVTDSPEFHGISIPRRAFVLCLARDRFDGVKLEIMTSYRPITYDDGELSNIIYYVYMTSNEDLFERNLDKFRYFVSSIRFIAIDQP